MKGLCSIVILSYNQVEYTKRCLESIREYTTNVEYELIVIDNGSDAETIDFLKQQKDIKLVSFKNNLGFARGCNQGIRRARGEYVVLLNNDTVVTKNWLFYMKEVIEADNGIAMVGPLTNNTVGKQKIEVSYGTNLNEMESFAEKLAEKAGKPWKTLRLVAFCVLIRKSLFKEIGVFDKEFKIGNYEDDDFNIRTLLAGKKMYICRKAFVHHYMSVSFVKNELPREAIMHKNKLLLEKKWNSMHWNHYAVFNPWLLRKIFQIRPERMLHLGCGLGALEIEIKESGIDCRIDGTEEHSIRNKIAASFLDNVYPSLNELPQPEKPYDVIVIEEMVEKHGGEILNEIKKFVDEKTEIFIRVFNIKHITTLERAVYGNVEGDLLCASSPEFTYQFDYKSRDIFGQCGYSIIEEQVVKKRLSSRQKDILSHIEAYQQFLAVAEDYSYIFHLRLNRGSKMN